MRWTYLFTLFSWSMRPSASRTPQWPCEVYSHRHTSAAISTDGNSDLIFLIARMTGVVGDEACEPIGSWGERIDGARQGLVYRDA